MSHNERSPLLENNEEEGIDEHHLLELSQDDPENPWAWPRPKKLLNVAIIALMAILSPLASAMFTPGISEIADEFDPPETAIIAATTGFLVMLGLGPLILAPLSETFGRRRLYLVCFTIFSLLQIPTALAPNIASLIALRTVSGLFRAVGIANGGGTISDMFVPQERAGVFGPLFGGITVMRLGWRWVFWILAIVCSVNTLVGIFFLRETYAPTILAVRKTELETESKDAQYRCEGEDSRPLRGKLARSCLRPVRIFVQLIVATMGIYQALIFATTYSIYTNMQDIYSGSSIDTVYKRLTRENDDKARPEFRLPLANIGAVLIPVSLFGFAWTVEERHLVHWFASISSTFFYGIGQVMILNTTQNYYIDSFEKYAASAIAAGTVVKSITGGVVPLFMPALFEKHGYGWGISAFAFVSLVLAPAPLTFYAFGARLREKFSIEL
ncbi:membrane transporter [Mytilinidion resinicola]|uniref:Membrane transporter n=1 Tax=Mytilinidion resinicola TaxID=574789 RepID=A0A6A6YAT6_9PEZI|nr:membrane transporter [Mytilinidion resinicola]KAF2805936.1 membrane transporter [Mytilinidion resinicola]